MKRSVAVADPLKEPITLSEAKKHLEIADFDDTHDSEVRTIMASARELWEHDTQSLTIPRTVTETLVAWPDQDWRTFYRPLVSIDSVEYRVGGVYTAFTDFEVDLCNRQIHIEDHPNIDNTWDAVKIVYTAGKETEIARHAIKLQIDAMFELRGMTKNKDAVIKAYESLVDRFQRSSYP